MAEAVRPSLVADQVVAPMRATSFAEVLDELGAFVGSRAEAAEGERLTREISNLGAEDVVPLGSGAFLLHHRSDAVRGTVVALGVAERPLRVPVETTEDSRGRIFALVVAAPDAGSAYLEEVATLAHLLRGEGVTDAMLEAGQPEGIAALPAVREAPRVQKLSVVDIMEPAAQRIYPDMDVVEAARIMARGRTAGLPVVNKRDEIVGMISEKDLIRVFLPGYMRVFEGGEEGERTAAGRAVKDVMSKAVLCLPTEASISEAASIIVNKNVDPLPLTKDGRWVGMISRRSLIRKLLQF